MEMLYAVHKKPGTSTNVLFDSLLNNNRKPTLCTVSTRNIIAYTTDSDINESDGTHLSGFYVYLVDLNTPWLTYKIATNKFPISILDWDVLGKYLLVGDISGNIQIFVQKDNLLSEWIQYYHVRLPGEHIIKAAFFHNGRKLVLQPDKKDITNYIEKFQRAKFLPSCRSFGGVPADGVLVVTATSLIGAFLIPPDLPNFNKLASSLSPPTLPQILTPVTQSLGRTRSFITIADICYSKQGNFMIAVANGTDENPASTMIHCYRVSVKKQMDTITLTSHSLPSFFLTGGAARDIPDISVTYLKWIYSEDSDSLLVGSKTPTGCFIELWGLMEKATPIHSHFKHFFQQPNKTEVFKTFVWTHQVNYRYTSRIIDICASKFQYGSSSYIFVSMADNTIHCLHRDTLKRLTNASLTCVWRNENDHVSKQTKIDSTIVAHDITWMGHLLLAVDAEGQLYAYRVSYPHQEQAGGQLSINYAVSLLEYCLVGGFDALDVFLILKVQQLDTIIDRLTENFTRQPAFVQQFFYVNFFAMKTNLYRLSVSGLPKAHDLTCFLMLHSILIGFKSLLRPSVLSSHDKGPAENLAMVLSESVPVDIDRLLLGLEVKEFSVEASTLQSLQQLIQWVADLALNILAKLPDNRGMSGMNRSTGYDISKDIVALNTIFQYDISKDIVALNSIRELLVVMRMWGLVRSQCLPVFSRSAENLDVLATLYKLLTRLTLNPNEPDELLLDECCLLPSQVLIPQLQLISPQYCIASPIMFYLTNNNLPLRFEYNTEPQCLKLNAECAPNDGSMTENIIDSIRHIQLGKKPGAVRRCTRCGAYSSLNSVAKTPAMRSWELRWASGCRCGGFWRLHVN